MLTQRWRLILARSRDAPDLGQRDLLATWEATLEAAGLRDPTAAEQPKLAFAAAISAGLTADRELVDLLLPQRRTAIDVRTRIASHLPAGHALVDLHDVWLGEPALPGLVVAGDYRVEVTATPANGDEGGMPALPPGALATAAEIFMAAEVIPRPAMRANRHRDGNLCELVDHVAALSDDELWMRLRFDPVLGTGRPEEVVAALGLLAGQPLSAVRRHRERLWLKGEERAGIARPQRGPRSAV